MRIYLTNLRKLYRRRLTEARRAANAKYIAEAGNPCKAAWNLINRYKLEDRELDKGFATPSEFNTHFLESVEEIVSSIPPGGVEVEDYLMDGAAEGLEFSWKPITGADVVSTVLAFKNSASEDIYGMTTSIMKQVVDVIAPVLVFLINSCLLMGVFPGFLKISRTVPVYKKGCRSSVASYRPISVIPVLAKLFESIMKQQLYEYFETHDLLVPSQYGFRKSRSTSLALEQLVSHILNSFEHHETMAVLLCDLSRAFDCVSHKILLKKLEYYGVKGGALDVFSSYLLDRYQVVSWNGETSYPANVKYGVPQGSVLGPLLFIIMINDLHYCMTREVLMFADDTTLLASSSNYLEARDKVRMK